MTKEIFKDRVQDYVRSEQVSIPENEEYLKALQMVKDLEERKWLRETKKEAFRMAIQIKPTIKYDDYGKPITASYNAENLIKDGNKIYEELIK